ncbi:putative monovalent cation/H+ antiporter subunit G [Bartonella australis AUST/NH1]|uniref:Putative monovalent cation/H+ antiporter subunit G n=1 Tax=Bartonella australis (strain Aust/NH1) TaxID=1094489 RepID=M1PER9_BARAA|nr:monovalent cation/H(+) antiporter subunit G [Bartonella australis]AGF75131.1 putative monovalent cation/H+ antiporter subunit G [Bartonella australis AUST/NH1]
MNNDISPWIAFVITAFLVLGSGLTLIGTIGLVRFSNFYERLHMPSLGTSWGAGSILIASVLYSIFVDDRFVFHEILLAVFLFVTAPVTSILLSQAAVYRDHSENYQRKPLSLSSHEADGGSPALEKKHQIDGS